MVSASHSTLDDISQLLANRADAQKLIEKLKTKLRENPTEDSYISLFVLQVAYFESEIKYFLGLRKDVNLSQEAPLGTAIKEFKKISDKMDGSRINIFYYRYFLDKKYLDKFIKYCWEINDLRINLYHNLFSTSLKTKPEQQNIRSILRKIRKFTEKYQIREYLPNQPDFYESFKNNKLMNTTNYRSLLGKRYSFPPYDGVTLELLINIALVYYGLELKFQI